MNPNQKKRIAEELKKLVRKESQLKIAKKAGVSNALISQMVNHKWDLISDEKWRTVKANLRIDWNWRTATTKNLELLNTFLTTAQFRSMSIAISYNAGAGKSHTYRLYQRINENVIYVECKNYWTKKSYIRELLKVCGLETHGTITILIERFISHVKRLNSPLIIIDQIDKLKDPQLDLFMDFYNELDGHCGFVLSGVPAFKKRIKRGCQQDKIGYRELFSRIGSKFISLDQISCHDVKAICKANGLEDEDEINHIFNTCQGDLRRVKRDIERYQLHKIV